MPYSNKMKSDYEALVKEKFDKMLSYCRTPQEIESSCTALRSALKKKTSHEQDKNKKNSDNLPYDIERTLTDLLELASNEGFELYATKEIIDKVHEERDGTSACAAVTEVPAFTSDKKSDDEKIQEAKNEFIDIIRQELDKQLNRIEQLSNQEKSEKIEEQQKDKLRARQNQAEMASRQPPQEGSEAHVAHEGIPNRTDNNVYIIRNKSFFLTLEDLLVNSHPSLQELQQITLEQSVFIQVVNDTNFTSNVISRLIISQLQAYLSSYIQALTVAIATIESTIKYSANEFAKVKNQTYGLGFQFFRCNRQAIGQLNIQETDIENTRKSSSLTKEIR
jgi:hypothetical protein